MVERWVAPSRGADRPTPGLRESSSALFKHRLAARFAPDKLCYKIVALIYVSIATYITVLSRVLRSGLQHNTSIDVCPVQEGAC
jgi:hypothetical protein